MNGNCDSCEREFRYELIHNGFNDSAFSYCERCGRTALLSGWCKSIPPAARLKLHGPLNGETEALLADCACGGGITSLP